jgi:putative iron-only hydrogenase system regulator
LLQSFPEFPQQHEAIMKRIGFVGIIIEDRKKCSEEVNNILSEHGELILARTGLPNIRGNTSVITLVIDANTDELGVLTGKLGKVKGISVKSGLAKSTNQLNR